MRPHDIVIAGGGIVGLATALQLQRRNPRLRIAILEKEKLVAAHQSSHNSGVIHSGIYYKPGSLRATNCKRGYDLLLRFCRENGVSFEICGKIIVATAEGEREQLDKIYRRGIENGLRGIRKISPEEAREIEPHVRAVEAVWVPQAGIVDYGEVARKYAEIFQKNGGEIFTGQKAKAVSIVRRNAVPATHAGGTAFRHMNDGVVVQTQNQEFEANIFVNCAGLYSDKIARLTGEKPDLQILPFRGEYYELKPASQHLVRNLIYPVPNPNFPFLGVHFTRMIHGGIEAGPNAVLAFQREGYSRWDLNIKELAETLAFPGFQKIARKYWRDGWAEMLRSYSKRRFVLALQRLVPEISAEDVIPGRSGVRAMACDRAGNLLDDFLILTRPRIVNVCNAPSPAATASLAVGETVAERVLEMMNDE
ncbi:MAG: L-2-hydroxyglutarate oxidase [Saprospiraceae bacterium]|nr:L-2-hydroxyglutarate oxidase [Saprospiraceae bacterium]